MRNRLSFGNVPRTLLTLLLLLGLALLASCGGGSDDDDGPPPAATGTLSITIAGVPAGLAGAVTVSGPNAYSRALTASATLDSLAPGSYTITAVNIANGTGSLAPTPLTQQVQLSAGATASASVSYAATAPLALRLPGRIGLELRMIVQGGLRILEAIEEVDYDVFRRRPKLARSDWLKVFWRAVRMKGGIKRG